MSERTLTLTAADVVTLRAGWSAEVKDSDGERVLVSMRPSPHHAGARLRMTAADLSIAAEPTGLTCGADEGPGGWLVKVVAS